MKILKPLLPLLLMYTMAGAQSVPAWKATQLRDYMRGPDSVLVINFWATFCKPCIEEIPFFEEVVTRFSGQKVKLLLVSLDLKDAYPNGVKEFAQKNNYSSQVVWLNETNADYFCPLVDKAWSGGIPSTLIINRETGYRKFFEQPLKKEELESEINKAL